MVHTFVCYRLIYDRCHVLKLEETQFTAGNYSPIWTAAKVLIGSSIKDYNVF